MFVRPETSTVVSNRTPVRGQCPECHSTQLAAYRVLSEGGWWDVVKCGHCLASLQRQPGPLLGPLTEAVDGLIPRAVDDERPR